MGVLTFFSFLTTPIIISSIYYQAIEIKQWCKFCLGIQVILVAEMLIGYMGGFYRSKIELGTLSLLLVLLILPVLVWKFIKPLLEKDRETNLYKRGLKKIKNNPAVLEGLLAKSRKIETSTEGLGILLKKDTAQYNVIKVCNPYCGPCATAHPILEGLVNKGVISLQILFTATVEENDRAIKPVRHLLAINDLGDSNRTKEAMDYWYLAPKRDYEAFARKYPIYGELAQQDSKVKAMSDWCKKEEITHTPTIFINGFELPNEYAVIDLVEVLM
jgi:thiol-disulfide isomerase/thioredoxin